MYLQGRKTELEKTLYIAAVYFYITMYPCNHRVLNIGTVAAHLRENEFIDGTVGERQAKGWPA